MPLVKSEFSCPVCKRGGNVVQIVASAGELSCVNGHRWNDTLAFMNENPVMEFKPEKQKTLPQHNHTPLTIPVPIPLKQRLEEAYGEKLSATVVSILHQMAEGHAMIVPETDVQRIADKLGKRPANSSELYGMVFAAKSEVDDMKFERDSAVQDLKAYEGMAIGRVVLDLGPNLKTVQEKAKDAELPVKLWVEKSFKNAIESGWF